MKKLLLLLFTISSVWQSNAQECWKQIDAGGYCVIGIKENGTLWGWGKNSSGDLGNTLEAVMLPVQIGSDEDWTDVSVGNGHVMALKRNGTLWAWGGNYSGQIGNGEITNNPNPTPIQIGTDNDWAFIYAGHMHSTAIKTNGTLWTWGGNYSGQLGNGVIDNTDQLPETKVPTQVGADTDWKSICASWTQNVAIKTNGTLWEWGINAYLPMSNGSTTPVTSPIQIGTETDWAQVAVGGFAISAIKTDGTLWSWGFNFSGGVGDGTNTDRLTPVQIGNGKWKSVNRGMGYFAGAIKEDGTLWTWGYNYYGQVGDGTIANKNAPTLIASDVPWANYQGASDYSVALKTDGSISVWGYNWYHGLGFNLAGNTVLNPIQVIAACKTVAILDKHTLSTINVYPNPTSGILNLANANDLNIEKLTVIDVTGKTLLEQKSNTSQINVQQLPVGMYFLEITTNGAKQHTKFIKE